MVNGREIYPLSNTKPVVIPVQENNPRLVLTDGFHITKPLKLVYKDIPTYCFKVVCAVSDRQLYAGMGLLILLYLSGFYTGLIVLKVLSFFPVLFLLFIYYTNRRDFIRLVPVLS